MILEKGTISIILTLLNITSMEIEKRNLDNSV